MLLHMGSIIVENTSAYTWDEHALCRDADPDIFFGPKSDPTTTKKAIAVCNRCPVREPCLEFALKNSIQYGVWGGTSERHRRKLKSKSYCTKKAASVLRDSA